MRFISHKNKVKNIATRLYKSLQKYVTRDEKKTLMEKVLLTFWLKE